MAEKVKEEPAREDRISNEIIVDAYGEEEQAMGWYNYLDDKLAFPFMAKCIVRREISPLQAGDKVKVVSMASDEECQHEMLIKVIWKRKTLAVPLCQLEVVGADDETIAAVADWHYWVKRGYQL
jgi:hypothetical protein